MKYFRGLPRLLLEAKIARQFAEEGLQFYIGYCPHPVTVYIRGPIKGYI